MKQTPVKNFEIHIESSDNQRNEKERIDKGQIEHSESRMRGIPLWAKLLIAWIVLFFMSLIFLIQYKEFNFSMAYIFKYASQNVDHLMNFLAGIQDSTDLSSRFYRFVIIAFTGAGLASCGAVFQNGFRNMLAGPSSMGVISGGSTGFAVYLFFFATTGQAVTGIYGAGRPVSVLIGSAIAISLVLFITSKAGKGRISGSMMVLVGLVFSGLMDSITTLLQYYIILQDPNDVRIMALRDMSMGNAASVGSLREVLLMCVPIALCLTFLIVISRKLNLLALTDEESIALGMNPKFYRNVCVITATIITAIVTAFLGHVGFVGFMIPLITRKFTGPSMEKLLPCSMVMGAIILTIIYDAAYFFTMSDSLNLFTSAIGGIVMLYTLVSKRGGKQ